MTEPTPPQRRAIEARGNVLVAAGAGAGKTRTLVERCLAWILSETEQGSVDQILMVTFTEAAATEMRHRLRQGLEAAYEAAPSLRLQEQMALLETAHVSTLHGFCLHLISQHFYELKIEGQARVLPAERHKLLAREALDAVLNRVYDGKIAGAAAIQDFIKAQGGDWDKPAREMAWRAHSYRHALPDPDGWLAEQRKRFAAPRADEWRQWLAEALTVWHSGWLEILRALPKANLIAAQAAAILGALPTKPTRAAFAGALAAITKIETPRGSKPWREQIADLFTEASFLHTVTAVGESDPLDEDWSWTCPSMRALLDLTEAYGAAYAAAKRAAGGMDFQDLEQYALRLLRTKEGQPSAIAEQWRKKFRLIFVDEYQDINGAQEAIISALGREGAEANRFLVGDVKQSIYRFRLADPRIFAARERQWREPGGNGTALALNENFRSHEGIIDFVNGLFETVMSEEVGGADYARHSRLVFGDRAARAAFTSAPGAEPRVELHVCAPSDDENASDDGARAADRDARIMAGRLRELHASGAMTHGADGPRPLAWRDMAVLLRSPRDKAEAYVKAFARAGVPLVAARGGFYATMEARDLLNLLRALDNPLQDLPLLGLLRSPFGGWSAHELARVRIAEQKGHFWSALVGGKLAEGELRRKRDLFVERFQIWRRMTRHAGVTACVERALDETHYTAWLGAQDRAPQRRANVARFLQLTRQFDAERGEGLARFLQLVEAQQDSEVEIDPAAPPAADAVRLMSIHQSKGLEFPVVALGDLGKSFNNRDAQNRLILDEEFGLCPQIKPPGGAQFYPTLAHWLAQRRQKSENAGEELRLLYVALTRARERLVLVGSSTEKAMEEKWPQLAAAFTTPRGALRAKSYLDWIGGWIGAGAPAGLKVVKHMAAASSTPADAAPAERDAEDLPTETLRRLDWAYPFEPTTLEPAKTAVTVLRRRQAALEDEEAAPRFAPRRPSQLGAAAIGSAHHAFLEFAALEKLATRAGLEEEAARLRRAGRLSAAQAEALDLDALGAFWQSEIGAQWLSQKENIRRELAFTAKFSAAELNAAIPDGEEFVVVQGAVDLAAILPEEIWVADFKTDHFPASDLPRKIAQYRPQVELYAAALSRIYRRPVRRSWLCFLAHRQFILL
ncbi:MAG TPA: UvrD-helicase domain-containing protein [Verrucomicrobiae bacterium]|jgi:ATP-dependent helicase/nuclease subunit A|nr:UvrD-helicase domain-containing protein [Verrucomicrobiae bacterium]